MNTNLDELITTKLIKQIENLNSFSNSVNWDKIKAYKAPSIKNNTITPITTNKANNINVDSELDFLDDWLYFTNFTILFK